MTNEQWQYLLGCEPSAFYKWLWARVADKSISKEQWFKISKMYNDNYNMSDLEKDIREVFKC